MPSNGYNEPKKHIVHGLQTNFLKKVLVANFRFQNLKRMFLGEMWVIVSKIGFVEALQNLYYQVTCKLELPVKDLCNQSDIVFQR